MGGISERGKEIKRRRHRRKKIATFTRKLKKATTSEKAAITEKVRRLTIGGETVLENLGLASAER